MIHHQKEWQRPLIAPVPCNVLGVSQPVISLNSSDEICWNMRENSWEEHCWKPCTVPDDTGAAATAGGVTTQDPTDNQESAEAKGQVYVYRCAVRIPDDFAGNTVLLRFEGAGCRSTVWADGVLAGRHYGSFTTWDCDITALVTPGQTCVLTVSTQDAADELNPYQCGGILRNVWLFAVPPCHVNTFHIETTFDHSLKKGNLGLLFAVSGNQEKKSMRVSLHDPDGRAVLLDNDTAEFFGQEKQFDFTVENPILWDSEHPALYTLTAELNCGGVTVETISQQFGFRQIKIRDGEMLINGSRVKLRGICRHEISPKNGKTMTKELIELDVALLKEANINFVRAAHYPPSEYFLNLCDQKGIYVLDETAVAFVDWRLPATQNDPQYHSEYMGQFAEMVERDRNHPSVILWGLGSESSWGSNFESEYNYVKKEEPTRPVLFNYPMTIPQMSAAPDIWSVHYAAHDLDLAAHYDHMIIGHTNGSDTSPGYALGEASGCNMPVLHDEFALVPCYNRDQQKLDPGVRDFWGESIQRFWDKMWNTKGCLGGAVWCAVDETNIYSGGNEACECGIMDVWRRKKPEFTHLQRAYSPVAVKESFCTRPRDGVLSLTVENRYNHTDFSELSILWHCAEEKGEITGFSLAPRKSGTLEIRRNLWNSGETLVLEFIESSGAKQTHAVQIEPCPKLILPEEVCRPSLSITGDEIIVEAGKCRYAFSKSTALMTQGSVQGKTVIQSGPYLNLTGIRLPIWQGKSIAACEQEGRVLVNITGSYGETADVSFCITFDTKGEMVTSYTIQKLSRPMPRRVKANVGLDCGGLDELGVYYELAGSMDTLLWERKGLWNIYPQTHIGRPVGEASRNGRGIPTCFGEEPQNDWSQDTVNYALYGKYDLSLRGTNDFRSTKRHILTAVIKGGNGGAAAISDGSDSIRTELVPDPEMMIDDRDPVIRYIGRWHAIEDSSGCWNDTETMSATAGDYAELTFTGTGICWYGSSDMLYGMAEVSIDGKVMDSTISLYAESAEKPGFSRGYEKRYQRLLYAIDSLPKGVHTIRIRVTGKKEPQSQGYYVSIDVLRVLDHTKPNLGAVRMIVNNACNYTRLVWGNYMEPPIMVGDGYTNQIKVKLCSNFCFASGKE